jgi:PilZ domain
MILGFQGPDGGEVAGLTTELRVRVLNVSAQGCLVETKTPLEVGTAATLRLVFSGGEFEDTMQVVRCQEITGAGVYHVGLTILPTAPASMQSLRYLIRRESGSMGWIRIARKD